MAQLVKCPPRSHHLPSLEVSFPSYSRSPAASSLFSEPERHKSITLFWPQLDECPGETLEGAPRRAAEGATPHRPTHVERAGAHLVPPHLLAHPRLR